MVGVDWVQAVGWASAGVSVWSYQARQRDMVVLLQAACCLLLVIHYLGLGSPVGALFNMLAMTRGLTALIGRPWRARLVLAFLPVIWGLAAATAHGPLDCLPALAMTCSTLAQATPRLLRLRLFMLASGPLWFAFAALAGSQGGMVSEILNIGSNSVAIYRYYVRSWLASRLQPAALHSGKVNDGFELPA